MTRDTLTRRLTHSSNIQMCENGQQRRDSGFFKIHREFVAAPPDFQAGFPFSASRHRQRPFDHVAHDVGPS